MSGGTDGVFWCHNEQDVRTAFEAECGKVNVNGEVNDCLLAQEFLDGIEYIVDCVSYQSKHVLCGIWQYKKIYDASTKSISYHHGRMIASTGEVQDQIVEYRRNTFVQLADYSRFLGYFGFALFWSETSFRDG